MKSIVKLATAAALAIALAAPAVAPASPPSKAKAWGKRCQGQSKVKDATTKRSPFKDCVKAKGVGYVVDENGDLTKPLPPEDTTGGDTGDDGTTPAEHPTAVRGAPSAGAPRSFTNRENGSVRWTGTEPSR